MPVEIYLHDVKREAEEAKRREEEAEKVKGTSSEEDHKEEQEETKSISDTPVNDTNPLWNENPSKVSEEKAVERRREERMKILMETTIDVSNQPVSGQENPEEGRRII